MEAVTILLWILRFGYQLFKLKSPKEAYEVLPSFHFRVMWLPGATAGSLWSLGNVGSIVAVEHLGQGVRNKTLRYHAYHQTYAAILSTLLFTPGWLLCLSGSSFNKVRLHI